MISWYSFVAFLNLMAGESARSDIAIGNEQKMNSAAKVNGALTWRSFCSLTGASLAKFSFI
jgi:hypothetical protein